MSEGLPASHPIDQAQFVYDELSRQQDFYLLQAGLKLTDFINHLDSMNREKADRLDELLGGEQLFVTGPTFHRNWRRGPNLEKETARIEWIRVNEHHVRTKHKERQLGITPLVVSLTTEHESLLAYYDQIELQEPGQPNS